MLPRGERTMKICMVVFADLPFDYRVYREAYSLQKAGHDLTIISSDFRQEPLPQVWQSFDVRPIDIDRSQSLRVTYPRFWQIAGKIAREAHAEVYHAHDLDALWPASRAAACHDAILIYDSHELFCEQSSLAQRPAISFFWRRLERRLIKRARHVITVGNAIADRLHETYHLAHEPVVLRNVPIYKKPVASQYLQQQLRIGPGEPIALYQGGFLTDNGLAEQIQAMQFVEAGHLALVGSGPTEQGLRKLTEKLQLQERVHFLPRVPFQDLHHVTCSADLGLCVIKPSGRSFAWSMPNKLFEYMMAGLPVLAGDTPEIRRVVEATDAGLIVDPLDPLAIAAALTQLLQDPDGRDELASAARFAARRNCWEVESQKLLDLYTRL